jgi:hypothetical protein
MSLITILAAVLRFQLVVVMKVLPVVMMRMILIQRVKTSGVVSRMTVEPFRVVRSPARRTRLRYVVGRRHDQRLPRLGYLLVERRRPDMRYG